MDVVGIERREAREAAATGVLQYPGNYIFTRIKINFNT
jgi:hypothetical protein